MKGIWFTARGTTEFCEEPRPVCTRDTALLRTLYSGLSNGTERNKLMGMNYHSGSYPDRIGYQHVSEVVECGEAFTRFKPGDVVFSSTFAGHVPFHLLPESALAVRLPEGFDRVAAAIMGVASVSMRDARLASTGVGDRVLVTGAGLIGLFAAQVARILGAHVTVVDRHQDRLELARQLGADEVHDNKGEHACEKLRGLPKFSVRLECSGGNVLDTIVGTTWGNGLLRPFSRLVLTAGRDRVDLSFNAASGCKLTVIFTTHFTQDDLEQVLRLTAAHRLDVAGLVREVVPIHDAVRVYDTLRDNKSRLLGTVFDWTGAHDFD